MESCSVPKKWRKKNLIEKVFGGRIYLWVTFEREDGHDDDDDDGDDDDDDDHNDDDDVGRSGQGNIISTLSFEMLFRKEYRKEHSEVEINVAS